MRMDVQHEHTVIATMLQHTKHVGLLIHYWEKTIVTCGVSFETLPNKLQRLCLLEILAQDVFYSFPYKFKVTQ